MSRKDVVDARINLILLVEEAPRCIGDRNKVVTNLEDHHPAHPERYPLMGDAFDAELCLTKV